LQAIGNAEPEEAGSDPRRRVASVNVCPFVLEGFGIESVERADLALELFLAWPLH